MKNKSLSFYYFILLFFTSNILLFSQFRLGGNNKGWLPVNSSSGGQFRNIIDIWLHMEGNVPYDYPNWSIVGRVKSPITNSKNKIFPVDKVKFRYGNRRISGYFVDSNPNANQIGVIQSNIMMSLSSNYFIYKSPLNINAPYGKYGSIVLEYDILIDGGNYLKEFVSWDNYRIDFEFSMLDEFGKTISTVSFPIDMQISPNGDYGNVIDPPSLGIEVDLFAQNAEIVFINPEDYLKGVVKEYNNALTITSNTPYFISVQAINDRLFSELGSIDLGIFNVQLKDETTGKSFPNVNLSTYPKTIVTESTEAKARKYSIIYSTTPNENLMNSPSGTYSTSLIYSVSPL